MSFCTLLFALPCRLENQTHNSRRATLEIVPISFRRAIATVPKKSTSTHGSGSPLATAGRRNIGLTFQAGNTRKEAISDRLAWKLSISDSFNVIRCESGCHVVCLVLVGGETA